MEYQFRPIEQWPGKRTRAPKRSQFSAGWSKTLELLERELSHLRARNIVIQADCDESQIRLDGMLRASARMNSQGIILSFDSSHGPLSYPCDRFDRWQDNVRAIALALEALRTVDRYGVTRNAEQYKGWAKLPPPPASSFDIETVDQARSEILKACGLDSVIWSDPWQSNAIRLAKRKTHPDHGGDSTEFKRVCRAEELILGS